MTKEVMHGIVIFCFDPRTDANLWKDIKAELIKPEKKLAPVACYGALTALARPADFPIEFAFIMHEILKARQMFEFAQQEFLAAGHNCGIYQTVPYLKTIPFKTKIVDIISAGQLLKARFPETPVSAWCKKPESQTDAHIIGEYANNRFLKQTNRFQQVYFAR